MNCFLLSWFLLDFLILWLFFTFLLTFFFLFFTLFSFAVFSFTWFFCLLTVVHWYLLYTMMFSIKVQLNFNIIIIYSSFWLGRTLLLNLYLLIIFRIFQNSFWVTFQGRFSFWIVLFMCFFIIFCVIFIAAFHSRTFLFWPFPW